MNQTKPVSIHWACFLKYFGVCSNFLISTTMTAVTTNMGNDLHDDLDGKDRNHDDV